MEGLLRSDRRGEFEIPGPVVRPAERLPADARGARGQTGQGDTGAEEAHRAGTRREVHLPAAVRHQQVVQRLRLSDAAHIHPVARRRSHGELDAVRRQNGTGGYPAEHFAGPRTGKRVFCFVGDR